MLLQVCVCVSSFSCAALQQFSSMTDSVVFECRTGPPSSWLALRAAANCQDHILLPSSLRFPAEQAGYTQTRLCSAAVDAAQRDPLLRRRSICLLGPARTYTVRVILAFTRVHRYTSSLSVQFRSLCHGFGMHTRCGLSRLSTNLNQRLIFSFSAPRWATHQYSPYLLQKCTTVSTCIEILDNKLINIHVMANNWL